MDAVDRIVGMGFSKQAVIRAFLTCDKNEEYTVNFLLTQGAEDNDDALAQAIAASTAEQAAKEQQPVASE
jgi:hypothetical protein